MTRVVEFDPDTGQFILEYKRGGMDLVDRVQVKEAMSSQMMGDDGQERWGLESIIGHRNEGRKAKLQIKWKSGESSWMKVGMARMRRRDA